MKIYIEEYKRQNFALVLRARFNTDEEEEKKKK